LRNLNMIRRHRAERNYALWKSRDPLDRDTVQRFGRPLSEVNAYYSPVTNTITLFAGILSAPFYASDYSRAAAYATVGTIIGHELSHAMDNNGRLFDENGTLVDWWSPGATREFNTRAACLVREYGAPTGCANPQYGEQTLGESIADVTGLTLAYRAANLTTREDKREFFQAFAQMWCSSYGPEHMCKQVTDDEHALAEMRVDRTLRQMREFREAFGCAEGQRMVNGEPCGLY
jgi:predicted metalloendopeptidase